MFEKEFKFMLRQFGTQIYLNDEAKPRTAILSPRTLSNSQPSFDDRNIHCDFKIKRGDMITYNDNRYLIISDVKAKRTSDYEAVMRPMEEDVFEFTYMTEGVIDYYDRLGNPVYVEGKEPKEVTEPVPCIIEQQGIPAINYGQINTVNKTVIVTLQDNHTSQQIEHSSSHEIFNHSYTVEDIILSEVGLRKLVMTW